MKNQWFVIFDGTYTRVSNIPEDTFHADETYKTFAEAKRAVVTYHRMRIEEHRYALNYARSLKKADYLTKGKP